MRNARPLIYTLFALLAAACPAHGAKPHSRASVKTGHSAARKLIALTPAQLARLVLPSVVRLTVLDASGQPSVQGSGFVVGPNLIATNVHVIRGAHAVTANFQNGRSETVYGYVAVDNARDLILLYANTNGVRALPLMTDTMQVGDPVVAVGSPEGLSNSLSTGIISQIRRDGDTKILQTTAPISHGSSGGALMDMYGRVLGITSFFNKDGQNLNFAYASYYLQQLMAHRAVVMTWAEYEVYTTAKARMSLAQVAAMPSAAPEQASPATPAISDAADNAKFTKKPLTGLSGVTVVVEITGSDAQAEGLDKDQLKTDAELRLRKAGITVYDASDDHKKGFLSVQVTAQKGDLPIYGFTVHVGLSEPVRPIWRDIPIIVVATTWGSNYTGTVGGDNMVPFLRRAVDDRVDNFINDYLAQNPK